MNWKNFKLEIFIYDNIEKWFFVKMICIYVAISIFFTIFYFFWFATYLAITINLFALQGALVGLAFMQVRASDPQWEPERARGRDGKTSG